MQSLISEPAARAAHVSARVGCTRCAAIYQSSAVYRLDELNHVATTRALLCTSCTQKLLANGHIKCCPFCQQFHSRGHRAPHCPWVLSLDRLSAWSYSGDGGAHGRYARFWRLCKRAVAEGAGDCPTGRAFFPEKTATEALRDCLKALHRRINLKAGVDTDFLGRKTVRETPRRLMGRRPRSEGCGRLYYDEGRERAGNCGHVGLCPSCEAR